MALTLYELPPSPNSIKIRLALGLKQIECERKVINPMDRATLVEVSGQPLAPVLVDSGPERDRVVFDSFAIMRYLDANHRDQGPRLYSADRDAPDKTYSQIGAFVTDASFSSKQYRIPPRVAAQMDPIQRLALDACHDALLDAGLLPHPRAKEGAPFDRERCAVILGNSLGGEAKDETSLLRIANSPPRGLGKVTITRLLEHATRDMNGACRWPR